MTAFLSMARTGPVVALFLVLPALAQEQAPGWPKLLDSYEIESQQIFTAEQARDRLLYRWVNRLHRPTTEKTIRQRLWSEPGDWLSLNDVAEIERNLRRLGVFADVAVREVDTADGAQDALKLKITTRDRLSLFPIVLPFSVGGINGFGAVILEDNLLGRADRLVFTSTANSEDERRTRFEFTNRQIGRSFVTASVNASTTEEGDSFGFSVSKPFQHLQDPWRWSSSAQQTEERVDFFEDGDSVAEVPTDTRDLSVELARGYGPITGRDSIGLVLRHQQTDYDTAIGEQANLVAIPGDTRRNTVGVFHRFRARTRFVVDENVDQLGVDEDLALGWTLNTLLAISERSETGVGDRTEPSASMRLSWAGQPAERQYVTLRVGGSVRQTGGSTRAYTKNAELHYFNRIHPRHMLAASVDFDAVQELDDLPPQLTLGENNGLRGYPSRQFAGRYRARFTLEDRYDLRREFLTFKLAAVAFFDAGWIGEESLGSMRSSVGIGLRFGSPAITGGRILRLDVAQPLDVRSGEDFGTTVSFSVSHSFDFFGRRDSVSER